MELTDEQRQRIYEEEKARMEIREQLEREKRDPEQERLDAKHGKSKKGGGAGKTAIAVIAIAGLLFVLNDLRKWLNESGEAPPVSAVKASPGWSAESFVTKLGPGQKMKDAKLLVFHKSLAGQVKDAWFARAGDLIYVVRDVQMKRQVGNEYTKQVADGRFLVANLDLSNGMGKKPVTLFTSLIKVTDETGREFTPSSEGTVALNVSGDKGAAIGTLELQPGVEKKLTLVYEVPTDAKHFTIGLRDGMFGATVQLPLIAPKKP